MLNIRYRFALYRNGFIRLPRPIVEPKQSSMDRRHLDVQKTPKVRS